MRSGIYTESDVPRILKRFTTYSIIIQLQPFVFKYCITNFISTIYSIYI